jgi:hypothetical protein
VTVLPEAPVLSAIDNPSKSSSYTVSWSAVSGAQSYQLEEATSADFANATVIYSGTGLTHQVSGKSTGTYYYRVRSVYQALTSPWSNQVSTEVVATADYYDSFGNANSGWTTHRALSGLVGCDSARENLDYKYDLYYQNGRYKVNVPLDCRAGGVHGDTRHIYPVNFAPGVKRPSTRTCVGMGGSFEDYDPYWSFWGVVFAASDDKSTVYSLEVNNLGDWGIKKRENYLYPGPNHPYLNENRTDIVGYVGGLRWPAKTAFERNDLKVEITRNKLTFYINNVEVYAVNEAYIVNEVNALRNVGIIGGNWEISPTTIGYDYFYIDEGCDTY